MDTGSTWPLQQSGFGTVESVAAVDASVAWATRSTNAVKVLKVTNGAAGSPAWAPTAVGPNGTMPRGVAALDANTAWVVGDGGTIDYTTNGGTSWTSQASGTAQNFIGVERLDADSLVAFGDVGAVSVTANGITWRSIPLPGAPGSVRDAWMFSDDSIVVVGAGGLIYTTANATNLTPTWTVRTAYTSRNLNEVFFTNATNGWALGEHGVMLTTTDAGVNWTRDDADTSVEMWSALPVTATTFVAVGSGATILRTVDSGVTWTSQLAGNVPSYTGVSMATDRIGWRVGSRGSIDKTLDGGATWTAQTSAATTDLFGVYAFSKLRAVIVGRSGTALMTSDGGTTWQVRSSGTTEDLFDVDGRGARAWAVGESGTIVSTGNWGDQWSLQSTTANTQLLTIAAINSTTAVAMGRAGASRRTTDRGVTWTSPVLPSGTSNVRAASAAPESTTVFYATSSTWYKSTDSGATWSVAASDSNQINAMKALSTNIVVGVGRWGVVRLTTNGGTTITGMNGAAFSGNFEYDVDAMDRNSMVTVGDSQLTGTTTSTSNIDDYQQGASDWFGAGTEAFGACLSSVSSATATWTPNPSCTLSDGVHWKGIPTGTTVSSEIARATLSTTGTANLYFGLRIAGDEPPGTLSAGLSFLVIAPDVA